MNSINYTSVAVFKLPSGDSYLKSFDKDLLVYMSPIKREKENSGRCTLKAGQTYIIVPTTEIPGKKGQFYLSIYFNQLLRDMDVKRVFHPNDQNTSKDQILPLLIPEEAEKLSS